MSKVLVDRDLLASLERLTGALGRGSGWVEISEKLRTILAQPAEAEGVEVVAWRHFGDRTRLMCAMGKDRTPPGGVADEFTVPLMTVAQHLAALSAVTAERDRHEANAYALSAETVAQGEQIDQLRAEVEALRSKIGEPELYTCVGKGGVYELIGRATAAGVLKASAAVADGVIVYRDTETNALYCREPGDFRLRMTRVAQRGEE